MAAVACWLLLLLGMPLARADEDTLAVEGEVARMDCTPQSGPAHRCNGVLMRPAPGRRRRAAEAAGVRVAGPQERGADICRVGRPG
jgi:hypothetical protein